MLFLIILDYQISNMSPYMEKSHRFSVKCFVLILTFCLTWYTKINHWLISQLFKGKYLLLFVGINNCSAKNTFWVLTVGSTKEAIQTFLLTSLSLQHIYALSHMQKHNLCKHISGCYLTWAVVCWAASRRLKALKGEDGANGGGKWWWIDDLRLGGEGSRGQKGHGGSLKQKPAAKSCCSDDLCGALKAVNTTA